MKAKRGRPKKTVTKTVPLQIRAEPSERAGLYAAADLAGITFSSWARERLRAAARNELAKAGKPVPF